MNNNNDMIEIAKKDADNALEELTENMNKLAFEQNRSMLTMIGFILAAITIFFGIFLKSNDLNIQILSHRALVLSLLSIWISAIMHIIRIEVAWLSHKKKSVCIKEYSEYENDLEQWRKKDSLAMQWGKTVLSDQIKDIVYRLQDDLGYAKKLISWRKLNMTEKIVNYLSFVFLLVSVLLLFVSLLS